jgi:phage terminase small subunit
MGEVVKKGNRKAKRKPVPKKAKDKPLTPRRAKFADNYADNGGIGKKAAEDAGFAKGASAEVEASRLLRIAKVRERIAERIAEAGVDKSEVIGTLVSHMRADFADILPDDKFIQQARANGVSHLLKELEITERSIPAEVDEEGEEVQPVILERKYKIKIHDSYSAAKQLCSVFGLNKKEGENPEDEKVRVETAIRTYIERTGASRDVAIKNLTPFIPEVSKYAN